MIDMKTVIFSYAISNAICVIVIASLWIYNRRRFMGLGFWLVDFAMQFAAVILASLRGYLPDLLSMTLSNTLAIGGTILLFIGLERFVGKRGTQIHNVVLLAIFISAHAWFTVIHPSLDARNIIFSLGLLAICSQCAWLLLRRVDTEMLPITRNTGIIFAAYGLVSVIRIFVDLVIPNDENLFHSNVYDTSLVMMYQMLFIALTFSLSLMVNRRLVASLELDLVERRQAETALKLSEEKFFKAFQSSPDAILITRAGDGKVLDVNEGFSNIMGYSQEEALSSTSINLNLWANPRDRDALLADLQEHRSVRNAEYDFRTKSDRILHCLFSGELIFINSEFHVLSVIRDVTERKRMEDALIASQILAEELYESAPDALVTVNAAGRITRLNGQTQTMFGYARDELLNQPIEKLIPKSVHVKHEQYRKDFFVQPRVREMGVGLELFAQRKDGSEFPAEIELSPLQLGEETFVTADIRDITERKQMEIALRYRTNVLAALHQVTLDLVNRHEMDDILQTLMVNIRALLAASDISFDLVENSDTLVTYAVTPGQPLQKGDIMRRGEGGWLSWQAIDSGQPAVLEDYSAWSNRRPLYESHPIHAIMIIPIQQRDRVLGTINISRSDANKPFNETDIYVASQLAQMVVLVLDNAQIYSQLQSELAESVKREGLLHEVQGQVIDQQRTLAVSDERQRMARDLHDSVNQSIHSLVLFSETLVAALDKNNVSRARQISERLQESARQALKETRLLLYQTHTSVKEGGVNLIDGLNARLAYVELRAGVRAQIIQEGSLTHCPEAWHEDLFWITIEALNNSLKHAQARSVQIIIRCFPNYMELEVTDNGRGFDITKPNAGGYGLRNMQERAILLGGKLTFTSNLGKGSSVYFRAEIKE
jgi:PAS domain S-box-containing protein